MHVAALNAGSKASRATACGCIAAGAIGMARIFTTSRWIGFCRCCIRRMSERSASSSPILGTSTNMRRCDGILCRLTWCCCRECRHDDEYRRASGGGRAADSGGCGGGRRSRAGHRQHGLRIRDVHRARMGDRAGSLAEAEVHAGRRGYRLGAACGGRDNVARLDRQLLSTPIHDGGGIQTYWRAE